MSGQASVSVMFRAMRNKSWTKSGNGRAMPAAFILREADPENGRPAEAELSVNVESHESCHNTIRTCFGVAELDVERVTALGLSLNVDSYPHAGICGLPLASADKKMAEHFASQLAKLSRLVMPEQYRAPQTQPPSD